MRRSLTIGLVVLAFGSATQAAWADTPCGAHGTFAISGTTASCTYTNAAEDTFGGPSVSDVRTLTVLAVGAPGGASVSGGMAGLGARATAALAFAGSPLYVEVGGPGAPATGLLTTSAGGFNGGGDGVVNGEPGAGGGGASDVRTVARAESGSLASRVLVAGGGGGAPGGPVMAPVPAGGSGAAGALEAGPPLVVDGGNGTGTAASAGGGGGSVGGAAGNGFCHTATAGTLGVGGEGNCHGGGGGGGYYGGGGGDNQTPNAGGGGAGSSMGPAGTTFAAAAASDVPEVKISWTVVPPVAHIAVPAQNGLLFAQGSVFLTAFSCAEGTGGPGISSCADSRGASGTSGKLDTSTPGPHTYTVTATSADGLTGTATLEYVVAAPPTVSIRTPRPGAGYKRGSHPKPRYTCTDGASGPGIASCTATPLRTSRTGRHTFTVTAKSSDGQTAAQSVAYIVVGKPKLRHVHQSAAAWHVSSGTRFSFTLNQKAAVILTFRDSRGKRIGVVRVAGHRGRNTVRFAGRIEDPRAQLIAGRSYSVTISARSAGGKTTAKPLRFTIV